MGTPKTPVSLRTDEIGHARVAHRALEQAQKLGNRQNRITRRIARYRQRLRRHQNARLTSALCFGAALFFLTLHQELRLELPLILIFLPSFTLMVVRTRRIRRHLLLLEGLRAFYDRQEKRCRGLPSGRSSEAARKASENLPLIRDLGLFGDHSLWTLIDETITDGGQSRLLEWISKQRNLVVDDILSRQKRIKELRPEAWFFTRLAVEANTRATSADFRLSSALILLFLKKPFVKAGIGWLLMTIWVSWLAAIVATVVGSNQRGALTAWPILIFAFLNFLALRRVGPQFKKGIGLSHHLEMISPIFAFLERRLESAHAGSNDQLQRLAPVIKVAGPSREARKLNQVLAFMSVEGNPLVNLLVNALSPWTITATYFLERRRRKIAYTFPQCMDELAEIEAFASLVIFDHYQTDVYPEIAASNRHPTLAVTNAFHPLIARDRVIANNFSFPAGKHLGLLTGSNMSGKSTFLRTLGINQILANIGAPVFADQMATHAYRLETCIEVSDSLRDGYSYFYAEVRRLKSLLDAAMSGTEPTLFLIDEIFRGTNNRERHVGSRAVIRALSGHEQAVGFISTHDLELTQAENVHEGLLNMHFREDFSSDGKMIFSYLLRQGPCPTTNALKIMAAEGIPVDSI